jgi:NADPH:quinone reductase-like Zn-dependent oxidoreductase
MPDAPAEKPFPLLIYGASTASGVGAVQYAKASRLTVVATASPHNFEYLKSLGADAVFDYKSPTCAADIKKYTGNKLRYAWDCTESGIETCAAAMSDEEPGVYGAINAVKGETLKATNPKVEGPRITLAYDTFGEPYNWLGTDRPAMPDELEFAAKFANLSEELLAKKVVKPIRLAVNSTGSGLEGILAGLDQLRAGKVSGMKLVYTL